MTLKFIKTPQFWIAIVALAIIIGVRMTPFGGVLSIDTLRTHREVLVAYVESHKALASTGYVLVYILAVALSLPGAAILTLSGGFLFGAALGTILTAVGATIGSIIIFLAVKLLLGDRAFRRLKKYPRLVTAMHENSWSYLLALRLVPAFPFFAVNLVAAFVGMKLSTYVLTTFFGILPGTAVYSLFGAGLGTILDRQENVSVSSILTPTVLGALVGLAALSLCAIPIRRRLRVAKNG